MIAVLFQDGKYGQVFFFSVEDDGKFMLAGMEFPGGDQFEGLASLDEAFFARCINAFADLKDFFVEVAFCFSVIDAIFQSDGMVFFVLVMEGKREFEVVAYFYFWGADLKS